MEDMETTLFNEPKSQEILENHKSSWARAEDLRKKDPTTYWSTRFQKKLHEQAMREKESFYNGK